MSRHSHCLQKSPAQHAADFDMLQGQEELKNVFLSPDGKYCVCELMKPVMKDHLTKRCSSFGLEITWLTRLATLVTTRSSGSSFLNRVELQNGCLSRGHSNLFIPSTLSGSCIEDGQINNDILCRNLELAIDTYISFVNKAHCGSTNIHLYKGPYVS